MKRLTQIAGICGVVLLFFGLVAYLFTTDFSPYIIIHLVCGGLLILVSLAFNLGGLWSTLGSRSTRYGANAIAYSLVFLGLLVGVNWLIYSHPWRVDVTEGGLFSLSSQSEKVLDNLKEDVTVLAFFQQGKGTKLEDLLNNFDHYSPKFQYEFIDPVKHPEKAKAHEVNSSDILVVKCGTRNTMINGTAEADLTNAILRVARPEQKKVYFLAGHGEMDLDDETEQGYQIVNEALQNDNYQVETLKLYMKGDVPEDCAALVVAGPTKALEQSELDAIDRYLKSGGDAFFLINSGGSPGMERLLSGWGVKVGNNVIVDQVFRMFYGPSLGVDPIVEDYGDHEITKDFKGQTLFHMVRSVEIAEGLPVGMSAVSLAKTSPDSWAETDLERFVEKSEVDKSTEDVPGPVSIAVAVTAELAEGEADTGDKKAGDDGDTDKRTKLVVIGDADFANNEYITKMYNGDLLLNAVSWLAGEEEYISVRPKATRGSRVTMTPQETQSIFYLSVMVIPEVLLLIGLAIWWRRR